MTFSTLVNVFKLLCHLVFHVVSLYLLKCIVNSVVVFIGSNFHLS